VAGHCLLLLYPATVSCPDGPCEAPHQLTAYGSEKLLSRCGENGLCLGGQGRGQHSWDLKGCTKTLTN